MMWIESCQIDGFGRLSGSFTFRPGFNVLFGPNEAGKSTLFSAILYGLYGFPVNRRSSEQTMLDRDAYRPLDPTPYKVRLVLRRSENERVLVERDFNNKTLRVESDRGGLKDITEHYIVGKGSDNLGEMLFGLSLRQYFFISKSFSDAQLPSSVLNLRSSDEEGEVRGFLDPLQRMLGSGDANVSAAAAIRALRRAASEYPGVTVSSSRRTISVEEEIRRLEKEVASAGQAIRDIEERVRGGSKIVEEIQARKRAIAASEVQLWTLELAELEGKRARHRRCEEALRLLGERRAEIETKLRASEDSMRFSFDRENELMQAALRYQGLGERVRTIEAKIEHDRLELEEIDKKLQSLKPREDERVSYGQVGRFLENSLHGLREIERRYQECVEKRRAVEGALESQGIDPRHLMSFFKAISGFSFEDQVVLLKNDSELKERLEAVKSRVAEKEAVYTQRVKKAKRMRHLSLAAGALFLGVGPVGMLLSGKIGHVEAIAIVLAVVFLGLWGTFFVLWRVGRSRFRMEEAEVDRMHQERERVLAELSGYSELSKQFAEEERGEALLAVKDRWQQFMQLRPVYDELGFYEKEEGELSTELKSKRNQISDYVKDLGFVIPGEAYTSDDPDGFHKALRAILDTVKELEGLSERGGEMRERLQHHEYEKREIDGERVAIRATLDRSAAAMGLMAADVGQLIAECEALKARYLERRDWETEFKQILGKMHDLEQERLSSDEQERIEGEIAKLKDRLSRHKERPAACGQAAVSELRETVERLRQERERLEKEYLLVEREKEDRLPELRSFYERRVLALKIAKNHLSAVTMARERIAQLAIDLQSQWVKPLNEMLNRVLKRLSCGISRVSVSSDGSVQLFLANGEALAEAALHSGRVSSGTREQIYFALKMALVQLLTQGRIVPLILDDPFITYDDERFETMFRVLKEGMANRQLIYFTCHEQRVGYLEERGLLSDCHLVNVASAQLSQDPQPEVTPAGPDGQPV